MCWMVAAAGVALWLFSRTHRAGRSRCALAWIALALALSGASSLVWAHSMDADAARLVGTASIYRFEVTSDASVNSQGASISAAVRGEGRQVLGCARLTLPDVYVRGDVLAVVGRIERLEEGEWERSRFMKGEVATVTGRAAHRVARSGDPLMAIRSALLDAIDPASRESRALVAGVVCGTTTELAQADAHEAFSRTGLSHLVAVSGGHLVLVIALVRTLLQRMVRSQVARSMALGAICVAYAVFTGGAPSAIRSAIMVCLGLAATTATRRAHGISSLSLTAIALLAVDPSLAHDLGFQLSAASVLFLGVFGRYLAVLLERLHLPRSIAGALAATLAAQWATLPLTMPVFGSVPLVSPLANLVVGPIMSGVLATGLVCAPLSALAPAFEPLMALPTALADLSIFMACILADLPFACVSVEPGIVGLVLPYVLAVAIFALWPDVSSRILAPSVVCIMLAGVIHLAFWLHCAPPSVTVLDVGQGDAILIRDRGCAILVDTGVDDAIVGALARNNVFRLDAVVITHWDKDHWGGLPSALEAVDIDAVYVGPGASERVPAELAGTIADACVELDCQDILRVGAFACQVVWPRDAEQEDGNAGSLVLDVRYESEGSSLSVLLTGDAEADQAHEFAADVGDIDVLKLGHHGSAESVDAEVLSALEPELAVASAGRDNPYGHPADTCVDAVLLQGAAFACTADCGDIRIEPARSGCIVTMVRAG